MKPVVQELFFFSYKVFFLVIFNLFVHEKNVSAGGKCGFEPCGYFFLKVTGLGFKNSYFYSSLLILISFAFCAQPV